MGSGASTTESSKTVPEVPSAAKSEPESVPKASESKGSEDAPAAVASGDASPPPEPCDLFLIHFNDVYNIQPRGKDPVGGAARFTHYVKQARSEGPGKGLEPLVLFSGDAFFPSTLSTVTRGKQMPEVLNEIGVHASVLGNHDLDMGLDTCVELIGKTKFPWLLSNCDDKSTGKPLGGLRRSHMLEFQGRKIGLMGLIESEWLATLSAVTPDQVNYRDFVEVAKEINTELREAGAQLVIALTHMREPNDERLCKEAPELDMVLGGHDHHYRCQQIGSVTLAKSGTDFRDGTELRVCFGADGKPTVTTKRFEIVEDLAEDPTIHELVLTYDRILGSKMDQIIGETSEPLDGLFQHIRTRETNVGNFVADVMREAVNADIAILNSGTLRADEITAAGVYKMRDLVNMLPMQDPIVKIELSGSQVLAALENGVCQYPRLEGRFPQVSGVAFEFDPAKEGGSRIAADDVRVGGVPLDISKSYTVATKAYLQTGKDGYTMFPDGKLLVDEEEGPIISICVRNHFRTLSAMNGFTHAEELARAYGLKWKESTHHQVSDRYKISPKVEGRIVAKGVDSDAVDKDEATKKDKEAQAMHDAHDMVIVHFNDVYNIEPREQEPVGGAARFVAKIKSLSHLNPLLLFSGDAFNPSMMSTITRGKQMPPVLNQAGVQCAVLGNHDLDHSIERFEELRDECAFPWLVSNCTDKRTGLPIAGLRDRHIMEWEGYKVGLIGLIEREWLATLSAVNESDCDYVDFVEAGTKLATELRAEGCQLVIAMTHVRQPNDARLAREGEGIDLILGGHDHHYVVFEENGVPVVKSGTDFREGTIIKIHFSDAGKPTFKLERFEVTFDMPEDPETRAVVEEFHHLVGTKMEQVVGETAVPLDARFSSIRTSETNIGNLICDICRAELDADVYLLNSGTLRADAIMGPGVLKMKDLTALVPMADQSVLLSLSGKDLLAALENGVSKYPRLEGRFPQVSGVKFEFDPALEPGHRVIRDTVVVGAAALDEAKMYRVGTKAYLALGKDGYDSFKAGEVIVDEENGPCLPTTLRNNFRVLSALSGFVRGKKVPQRAVAAFSKVRRTTATVQELGLMKIAPKIEGRIVARA